MNVQTEPALWFDGRSAERRHVSLAWRDGTLTLHDGLGPPRHYAPGDLQMGPCWLAGPWALALPDGGTLWLERQPGAPGPVARQLLAAQGGPSPVDRASSSLAAVLLATQCAVMLLVWLDRQGLSLAAERLVAALPRTADVAIGQRAFTSLDQSVLAPSRTVAQDRQQALQQRWQRVAAAVAPGLPGRLYFRTLKASPDTLNAFAFPDGSVVVLDTLVQALSDDEMMALLGHELGHVVHRHGLKGLAQGTGVAVLGQLVLGDFSSWAASLASGLQALHFHRDAEREADAFIPAFLAAAGLPADAEVRMWLRLQQAQKQQGSGGDALDWLSTHPGMAERIEAAKARSTGAAGL